MNKIRMLLATAAILYGSSAAAAYTCFGPVTGAMVAPDGNVAVSSLGGAVEGGVKGVALSWPYFCNINSGANGVGPEACKAIYATLLSAQLTGKNVRIWFNDSGTCSSHSAWSWLTGWYWGPSIE